MLLEFARFKKAVNEKEEKHKRKVILDRAVKELLQLLYANGGANSYGDISLVIAKYKAIGYTFVTNGAIVYRLNASSNQQSIVDDPARGTSDTPDGIVVFNVGTGTGTSTRTNVPNAAAAAATENESTLSDLTSSGNQGGRKSGSTDQAKLESALNLQNALTKASLMYAEERNNAKRNGTIVRNGCLQEIASQVESEFTLPEGSIVKKTVFSRVDRGNCSDQAPQRTSPIATIEPFVIETCICLANMGSALTKDQVLSLASSFIEGTELRNSYIKYKGKRKLYCNANESSVVGEGWYQGFMKRNSSQIIRRQGKDIKCHTWFVYERFEAMYDSVYDQMVKSNVAIMLDKEVYQDKQGNIVETQDEAFGLPSK